MKVRNPRFDVTGQLAAVRRYARALARAEGDAEDLVQDALLKAYEHRAGFKPGRSLRAWLFSILHNSFIDGLRRRRAEAKRDARAAELAETEVAPAQDQHLRLAELRRAFMDLPPDQREALHLVAIEGLSYQEAAQILGLPIGTLMSRLGRARAALRALEEGASAPGPAVLRIVGGSDA